MKSHWYLWQWSNVRTSNSSGCCHVRRWNPLHWTIWSPQSVADFNSQLFRILFIYFHLKSWYWTGTQQNMLKTNRIYNPNMLDLGLFPNSIWKVKICFSNSHRNSINSSKIHVKIFEVLLRPNCLFRYVPFKLNSWARH